MRFYFAILFLFQINFLSAQEHIEISGTTIDAENQEVVPYVHIFNISQKTGITSDQNGRFSLKINKQDTLHFSSIGYTTTRLIFQDSSENAYKNIRVKLRPITITLNPVEVRAYHLEEILNKNKPEDVSIIQEQPEPLFEEMEKVEKPAIGIGVSPGGATLEGAITAFANLFNKDFKQRKKLKQIIEKEKMEKQREEARLQLESGYTEVVRQVTGLAEEELQHFLQLYMPDLLYLINASDYDLALKIYHDYREYRYKYKLQEVSLEELLENASFRK